MVDTGWVELSTVGDSGTVVVSVWDTVGTAGFVVVEGEGEVSEISGGLEVVVSVALAVVGMAVDQEVLSVEVVEVETVGGVAVSVIFRGGGAAVVVVTVGVSDAVDSGTVTFFVDVCQSVVAEVAGGSVVVSATWTGVDVGNSGAVVVEVVSSVGLV